MENRLRAGGLILVLIVAPGCGGVTQPSAADAGAMLMTDAAMPAAQGQDAGGPCDVVDAYDRTIVWDFEAATLASSFFTFHDNSPMGQQIAPPANGPASGTAIEGEGHCGSRVALRVAGANFVIWGAGAGNALGGYAPAIDGTVGPNGAVLYGPAVYDASRFDGMSFWARSLGGINTFQIGLTDGHTDQFAVHALVQPPDSVCTPAPLDLDAGTQTFTVGPESCGNEFQASITATSDWAFYVIRFDEMKQRPGAGFLAPAVDSPHLFDFFIHIGTGSGYDLWFDDIGFFKKKGG